MARTLAWLKKQTGSPLPRVVKAAMKQKEMKDRKKKPGEKEQKHMVAVDAHKQRLEM